MKSEVSQNQEKVAKNVPLVIRASTPVTSENIADRAYLQHVRRGCVHGFDVEDWLAAESELIKESCDLF
ncbi:hypothetical protein BH10CYA1_BH10CYA1_60520 [soil metagenome]